MTRLRVPGSFRDPSGFVFTRDGVLYRQVQARYAPQYRQLVDSGLAEALMRDGLLIPHRPADLAPEGDDGLLVIQPERVPFISYPYEWSFSQLRDAALATLRIATAALDHDMVLKDASAYNIQFVGGKPMLIDTLSFERYQPGEPWVAYRQFCQHFLAPLALMSAVDVRLSQLFRVYLDGIPLDLAASLLPLRARMNPLLYMHLVLHARFQQKYAGDAATQVRRPDAGPERRPAVGQTALRGMLDSLRSAVEARRLPARKGEWTEYYTETNYTTAGLQHKEQLVEEYLAEAAPATVWDLGANDGHFSRLATKRGSDVVAFDGDPLVVEACYRRCVKDGEPRLLPLTMDLANPSPALGWAHTEREALLDRGPADLAMALALIHHLAISNNVPLPDIAAFLRRCGRRLIIEFVPREDSQVQRLLAAREDIFTHYTREGFEAAFTRYFAIRRVEPVHDSRRLLYLMESLA
ncbi:MAG: class I SAM-dependent methyltransferase [Armatimonadota bacterium]